MSEVSGRQLKVHYDGWPDEYDWWFDDDSPDIHPTSWCSKTGHPLMPPLSKSGEVCPVLAISYLGAKHDFEIWAFKVFFSLDKKSTP